MKKIRLTALFCIALLGIISSVKASENKNITRTEDPVIVRGEQLNDLLGVCIEDLTLMAYVSGEFRPIPFQIDQKHPDGEYAYIPFELDRLQKALGKGADGSVVIEADEFCRFKSGDQVSNEADVSFDKNDELVFMVDDLGDRIPEGQMPPGAIAGMVLEIVDPCDGKKGWAYLLRYKDNPPRSSLSYVKVAFNPETNHKRIITKNRKGKGMILGTPLDALYPDELRLVNPDGTSTSDMLDLMKMRGKVTTKFFISFNFSVDQAVKEKITGFTMGPIRGLYKSAGYFEKSGIKIRGVSENNVKVYRNSLNVDLKLGLPFRISTFLKSYPIKAYLDFNEHVQGFKVYSESYPPPVDIILNGEINETEDKIINAPRDGLNKNTWIAGCNSRGEGLLFRFILPKDGSWAGVSEALYLNEDLETPLKPEDHPGELAVGVVINGIETVEKKTANFNVRFYGGQFFGDGRGIPKHILDIEDVPIKVKTLSMQETL